MSATVPLKSQVEYSVRASFIKEMITANTLNRKLVKERFLSSAGRSLRVLHRKQLLARP